MSTLTLQALRKMVEEMEEAYKYKVPTEKFKLINDVLQSVKTLVEDDDLMITMEYHMSSVAVVITGYGFGVAPVKMDIWREICSKVDSVDFYPTTDDEVRIILAIENVFVPA